MSNVSATLLPPDLPAVSRACASRYQMCIRDRAWAARDTAPMVRAANMNGIMAPMKIPATMSGSVSVSSKFGMAWCMVAW